MIKFLEQFRERLERRPEPVFNEQDWAAMERRLDQQKTRRPAVIPFWMAFPAGLLMLLGNTLFLMKWKEANRKIASMELHRDTIVQEHVVYKTDTVFVVQTVQRKPFFSMALTSGGMAAPAPDISVAAPVASHAAEEQEAPGKILEARSASGLPDNSIPERLSFGAAEVGMLPLKLSLLTYDRSYMPQKAKIVHNTTARRRKTIRYHLNSLRPTGLQIGVNGGCVFPVNTQPDWKNGYSAAIQANLNFSGGYNLWADVAYLYTHFDSDRMDASIGVPHVGPPSDNFDFVVAEVPQPMLQFSAGIQYTFNREGRLKPFAGLGFGAASLLPYEVTYEFVNKSPGIEWNYELPVARHKSQTGLLMFRAGIEYDITNRWSWMLRATGRAKTGKNDIQVPAQVGLDGGFFYRIGAMKPQKKYLRRSESE